MAEWPSTQRSLVERIRDDRDAEAWTIFVQTYRPLIEQRCMRHGVQGADAEEVTADILLRLRKFTYRPDVGRLRGYLRTIIDREVWRLRKKLARRERAVGGSEVDLLVRQPAESDPGWDATFVAHILDAALERIKPEFDPDTWNAFLKVSTEIREADGCRSRIWLAVGSQPGAARETAAAFGREVAWVYKVKFRVMRRLKEEVLYLSGEILAEIGNS